MNDELRSTDAVGANELPPVLMVHGTFSRGAVMAPWARYFERRGFDVHTPSLPGRDPTDRAALRRLTMRDYLDHVLEVRAGMSSPPIVIGHSMGGLLTQQVAARTECAAAVLLASVPPGVLWAQPRAVPHLMKLLPQILLGRAVMPSRRTLQAIVFNDLQPAESAAIASTLVPDSGRSFRSLIFGAVRVPRGAVSCPVLCVSGGADRNVSPRISRLIAKRYHAEHHQFAHRGHWIVAESGVQEVAGGVLAWLEKTLGLRVNEPVHAC